MAQRIIRYALDMWDFVIVELIAEGNWDATTIKYRGAKVGATATRDELDEGASYELPDGRSLNVVLPTTLLAVPRVTLNGTRLCPVTIDPFQRVRRARNAARFLGAMQLFTLVWFLIQKKGDLTAIEFVVPLVCGMIYLLLAEAIAHRSQVATLATALLAILDITAIVMTPAVLGSTAGKIGAVIVRLLMLAFIARAVRAIHRIKKAEAEQSVSRTPELG